MVNLNELKEGFASLGVSKGDVLLIHASFKSFGPVEGGPQTIIDAILSLISEEGTLIAPTFNFDFCSGKTFDILNTPSQLGILTEFVRKDMRSKRILHPIHSFSILGKLADSLGTLKYRSSFGRDSLLGKLMDLNGKIMILGVPYNHSLTLFHYIEEMEGCDYRYLKDFTGRIIDANGREYQDTFTMYVRDLQKSPITNVEPMGELLEKEGIITVLKIGDSQVRIMKARDVYERTAVELKKNPHCLVKFN